MKRQTLKTLIAEAGVRHMRIAEALKINKTTFSNRLSGRSPFTVDEIDILLALLSRYLGRRVTYEMVEWPGATPIAQAVEQGA